jgi:hypothetical protein
MTPPEPNKKMDDLLGAYAKKRREDAGAELELPSHRRAQLHEEIRRTLRDPDRPRTRVQRKSMKDLWFKLGLAAAGFGVCIAFIILQNTPPTTVAQLDMSAQHSLPPAAPASVEHVSAPPPAPSPTVLTAAPMAAPAPPIAVNAPNAGAALPESKESNEKGAVRMMQAEQANSYAATLAAPAVVETNANGSAQQLKDFGVPSSAGAPGQFVNYNAPGPAPDVLAAFRIQRTGDTVQVVDQDGSVYSGYVMTPLQAAIRKTATLSAGRSAAGTESFDGGGGFGGGQNQAPAAKAAVTQNQLSSLVNGFSFRVSGLSRRLNENVTFTGNIPSTANPNSAIAWRRQFQNATSANNTTAQNVHAVGGYVLLSNQSQALGQDYLTTQDNRAVNQNIRLTGAVQIGPSNQFNVEAVPVQP